MKLLFFIIFFSLSFSSFAKFEMQTILSQKDVIWGFDFLNKDTVIFTERNGKLYTYQISLKKIQEISGVPSVYAEGQGGLLDVRVHPKNEYIYITYSEPFPKGESATALARFKIKKSTMTDFKKLFTANSNRNPYHYGSRIEFINDKVYVTSGERGDRPAVQRMDNYFGKIVQMNEDGSDPIIWTLGHRSPQGLAFRPGTEELWQAEMGPQGGDEINLIKKGLNYGWPIITYGKEYEGPAIGEGTHKKGMEQPIKYWVPSISPSAITFYTGDKMSEWKGNLFLALLSGMHLRRLELKGTSVVSEEELFKDLGWRFRNVRTGPDGHLWVSTDEGKLARILPKSK